MLNALVPASLPESVAKQYKDQFVTWPNIPIGKQLPQLFASLQALRSAIKSLMDFQFTSVHLKPLFELCTTLRLKCLGIVVDKTSQAIVNLGSRETWKIDVGSKPAKTILPDFYETEITEALPCIKEILSFSSYPGELDLFTNERIRQMILDLFIVVLMSFKQCYDQLLQLKGDQRRPNRLLLQNTDDSSSISSMNEDKNMSKLDQGNPTTGFTESTGRKLLMTICNVEYVTKFSLNLLAKRLSDNRVKYCDSIIEKCRQKFENFCQTLLKHYLTMKTSTLHSLVETINYDYLPEDDDVSYFIKELITCVVFIQAELCLFAPQLLHKVLTSTVEASFDKLVKILTDIKLPTKDHATQVVIDLTALEEAFQSFLSIETRRILNSIRARLMDKLDKEKFQICMQTFRQSLHLAIESLQNGIDEMNTSNV
uniref:Exocyst complex component 2 n=1 Tax=Acrobeloides nanus TaxID=290746 RepID=A0A914CW02_9BILA